MCPYNPSFAVVEDLVQDVTIQAAFAEIEVSQQSPTETAPVDQQQVSHEKWIYCVSLAPALHTLFAWHLHRLSLASNFRDQF